MDMKNRIILAAVAIILVAGTVNAQEITGLAGWDIYLDPGHSQTENQGIFGYSEAEKNLGVGLALRALLLERTDIDTVYISRTNHDVVVSLSQRSDHANSLGATWFHSIHSDAGSPTANSTLLLWGQLLSGAEKTPPGGNAMSDHMVDNLTRVMRTTTRGSVGDCSFYRSFIPDACSSGGPYLSVNRRTTMASELSESGFHTNPTQNMRNMGVGWKLMEARSFFWSILDYHGIPRPVITAIAGFVKDAESGRLLNGATVTIGDSTYTTDTYESLFNQYSNDPEELRNGFYFLDAGQSGSLDITVEADDYETYSASFASVDSFLTFHDVDMIPAFPPAVASITPMDSSTLQIDERVVIDFNRKMDRESVENAFSLEPVHGGTFQWSNNDFTLTFVPDSFFTPESMYSLTITDEAQGVFGDVLDGDGDGNSGGDFELQFETGLADVQAPNVASAYPANNQMNLPRDVAVTMVFDEFIDPASYDNGDFVFEAGTGGGPLSGQLESYNVAGSTVFTFFPDDELKTETYYRLQAEAGLADVFGNETTTSKSVVFRVGINDNIYTNVDRFDGGVDDWWVPQQSGTTTGIVTDSTNRSLDTGIINLKTSSTGSMRLDYGWDTDASTWLIRTFLGGGAPANVLFDSTFTVQAQVFGDGSGNLFRFALDDNVPTSAAGNHEVSPWYVIDWKGWKRVVWQPGKDGAGSWLGDGSLDGTLRFDSIQLSHVEGAAEFGTIYVDDLRLSKTAVATYTAEDDVVPTSISMQQNYPNPFQGETTFTFSVPENSRISLTIYNTLGSEVARVVEEADFPAGSHSINWRADNLASGVYLARLSSGEQRETIRIVVLK